jgi:hypothetical protein
MLIMDGLSIKLLIEEIDLLYQNPRLKLPKINTTFRDYVLFQEQQRATTEFKTRHTHEIAYWQHKITTFNLNLNLPLRQNNLTFPHKCKSIIKTIEAKSWKNFTVQAQKYNISPMRALLYLYGIVLCYYSNQENFCINVTLGKRKPIHPDINKVIGDFTQLELFNFKNQESTFLAKCKTNNADLNQDLEHLSTLDGINTSRIYLRATPYYCTSCFYWIYAKFCNCSYVG